MFYVYIIESATTSKWYYGSTKRTPAERLLEHNGNHHHFTANFYSSRVFSIIAPNKFLEILKPRGTHQVQEEIDINYKYQCLKIYAV
jgi:hypothetical protein